MTRDIIPKSRGLGFKSQNELLMNINKELKNHYEIPTLNEAAVSILMDYLLNNCTNFSPSKVGIDRDEMYPATFTRCQDSPSYSTHVATGYLMPKKGITVCLSPDDERIPCAGLALCISFY